MTAVDFEESIVWIKWIGTHREYDRIDVRTVEGRCSGASPVGRINRTRGVGREDLAAMEDRGRDRGGEDDRSTPLGTIRMSR